MVDTACQSKLYVLNLHMPEKVIPKVILAIDPFFFPITLLNRKYKVTIQNYYIRNYMH